MDDLLQTTEQRLARLGRYVAKIEQSVKELEASTARGDLESLNDEQIRYYLTNLPQIVAETGIILAKTRRAYAYAKNDTKTIRAKIRSEANREKESLGLSSASDRDDYVQTKKEYQDALKLEFEWAYNCDVAEVVYNRYNDNFVAVRKLASLAQENYQMQDNATKYGG